ncbi:hypothetical protein BJQ90_02550 [Arthrobacter sp. SO3]|nr:hypothetical protein [Arthrobacter sp. SO3]
MDGDALLDQDLPMDPGPDPDQELPQDPFPDWTEPLVDTYPESVLRHVA